MTTSKGIGSRFRRRSDATVASDNERQVLDIVRRIPGVSRADLSRHMGLSNQSASRLVDSLESRGLLVREQPVAGGRGQPKTPLKLAPEAVITIGVSMMTDAASAVMMDFCGEVVLTQHTKLDSRSAKDVIEKIASLVERLIQEGPGDRSLVFGVGVSVTGFFTGEKLRFNPPSPLSQLTSLDVDELLASRLGLPVWLDNDGTSAAMGEALAGAGRQYDTFAYIYFSYGIGGGLIIDRKPIRGVSGNAGEFAGLIGSEDKDEKPTLERLRMMLQEDRIFFNTIEEMISEFDLSWPAVLRWVAEARPHLEKLCNSIAYVVDPQAIVLGGRLPASLAHLLADEICLEPAARRGVRKPLPRVISSQVMGDAAAIGAAATPLKASFFL